MAPLVSVAQHVPAWKRLGLKLKYAKDEPAPRPDPGATNEAEESKKRKAVDEGTTEESTTTAGPKKAKWPKKSHSFPVQTSPKESDHHSDNSAAVPLTQLGEDTSQSPSVPKFRKPNLAKRKSVTFAPEAKTTDGDSAKELYDQWLVTQRSGDATFDPTTADAALQMVPPTKLRSAVTIDSASGGLEGQKKKNKKHKNKSKSTTIEPGQPLTIATQRTASSAEGPNGRPHPALSYLTDFHTSPATWKFCKKHQVYLLKNLLSLEKVPSSFDPAIKAYLVGLKGISGRQSVRAAALKVREEDEMFLSDILAKGRRSGWEAQRRRDQYEAAWKREKDRLEEIEDLREWEEGTPKFEWRLKKRRRAEDVLWAVGETETQVADGKATNRTDIPTTSTTDASNGRLNIQISTHRHLKHPEKKKRKRKRRTTGVPDDESSSSSSSSDSDSESGIESKALNDKGLRKLPDAGKPINNSGRSSGLGGSGTESDEGDTSSGDSQSASEETESDDEEQDGSSSGADGSNEDESDSSDD